MSRQEWMTKTYEAVDALDLNGFLDRLADDVWVRFGNAPPVSGKKAAREAFAEFFEAIKGMAHETRHYWEDGDRVGLQSKVAYTRSDGRVVNVPAFTVWKMDDQGLGRHVQIFADVSPVFDDEVPRLCDGRKIDVVDEASWESFPASDPPAFTGATS